MERLEKLSKEAMRELDGIGVKYTAPVKWELSNATSTWGTTHRDRNPITGKWEYRIRISKVTLDPRVSDEHSKDTIIHELIHTVPGCWDHKYGFKDVAALVNDCYACYHISRTANAAAMGITREVVAEYGRPRLQKKYIVGCFGCGAKYIYHKQTKLVKILASKGGAVKTNYTCPCGCNTFVLF